MMSWLHIGIAVLNAPVLIGSGIVVRRRLRRRLLLALALDEAADGATDGSTTAMATMMSRMRLMVMGLVLVVLRHD